MIKPFSALKNFTGRLAIGVGTFGVKMLASDFQNTAAGRHMRSMLTTGKGPLSLLKSNLSKLIRQSRSVLRTNIHAVTTKEAVVANTIGTGIQPQSEHPDEEVREKLDDLFEDFCVEADPEGMQSYFGLQTLACHEFVEAGGCLARWRPRRLSDNLRVPLQLQLLQIEHLDREKIFTKNKNRIVNGIEYNPRGQRVAYHVYQNHPGDPNFQAPMNQSVRVKAENMLHVFRPVWAGQNQGLPLLSQALFTLDQLEKYGTNVMLKQSLSNLFMAFIKQDPESKKKNPIIPNATNNQDGTADASMEPAITQYLEHGEEVTFSNPPGVGVDHDPYVRSQLAAVSSSAMMLYYQISGDLRNINFSSVRAGIIEMKRKIEAVQHHVFIFQFCRPVWERVIKTAVISGAIDLPGYIENPRPFHQVAWVPQGREWVDPLKDAQANALAVANRFTSVTRVVRGQGINPRKLFAEIAREQKKFKELDITPGEVIGKLEEIASQRENEETGQDIEEEKEEKISNVA